MNHREREKATHITEPGKTASATTCLYDVLTFRSLITTSLQTLSNAGLSRCRPFDDEPDSEIRRMLLPRELSVEVAFPPVVEVEFPSSGAFIFLLL